MRIKDTGANGIVLFNRFYHPYFEINDLTIKTNLQYNESNHISLPLLWVASLYGKIKLLLAAATGG